MTFIITSLKPKEQICECGHKEEYHHYQMKEDGNRMYCSKVACFCEKFKPKCEEE